MSSQEHAKMSSGTVCSQQSSPAKPKDKESGSSGYYFTVVEYQDIFHVQYITQ